MLVKAMPTLPGLGDYEEMEVGYLDAEQTALALWNYRLNARSMGWLPSPRYRCVRCQVKWVGCGPLVLCSECNTNREKETTHG